MISAGINNKLVFAWLLILLSFYSIPSLSATTVACSSNAGSVVINEVYNGGNDDFIELLVLADLNISNWQLKYYDGNVDSKSLPYSGIVKAGTYIVVDVGQINPNAGEVVLLDSANSAVDYLYYGTFGNNTTRSWLVPSGCGTELPSHESHNSDIARIPNGEGDLQDNTSSSTSGVSNDGNVYVPSPALEYRFDECFWDGSDGEVVDSCGNGQGGAAQGGTQTDVEAGYICRGAEFDGNDDYIALPNFPDQTDSFTITAWFRTNDRSEKGQRIFADDENNSAGYAVSVGDGGAGRVRFYHRGQQNSGIIDSDNLINNDTWYFVAAVEDRASGFRHLYLFSAAGALLDHKSLAITGTLGIDSGMASIGGETVNGETANRFVGSLDEIKVFDGALAEAAIRAVCNDDRNELNHDGTARICTSCALAEWRLDECVFDGTVSDSGGNNFIGTIVNALESRDGKLCSGGYFAGANSYIQIDDEDKFDDTQQLTLSMWFNAEQIFQDNGTNARGLISKRVSASNAESFGVFFWNGHGNKLWVDIDGTNDRFSSATNFSENNWYHIDVVYDGSLVRNERVKLYVNGVLDSMHAETSTRIPGYNSDLYIGNLYYGSGALKVFKGTIDEVRIVSKALDAQEVATNYQLELDGFGYDGTLRLCTCAPDHFMIDHDGSAINCMPEEITISAHAADHSVNTMYSGTVELSTSTSHGDWLIGTGHGVLDNGINDDGVATYTFDPLDAGSVKLLLSNIHVETVNIDVAEGLIDEHSGTAQPVEDQDLVFKSSGFFFHVDDDVNSDVPTQICGKGTNQGYDSHIVHLVAIATDKTTNSCLNVLDDDVTVKMGYECIEPTECSDNKVEVFPEGGPSKLMTGTNYGATRNYTNVPLVFGDDGAKLAINYYDAGKIKLFARYSHELEIDEDGNRVPNTGLDLKGDSNDFVVRPFGLAMSVPDNATAQDTSGDVFIASGAEFALNIEAVCWQGEDDLDNDGIPDGHSDIDPTNNANLADNRITANASGSVAISHELWKPESGVSGVLAGTTSANLSGGSATISDLTFSEVGIIELHGQLVNYLNGGEDVLGRSGAVGRFYPDHFELTRGVLTPRVDLSCPLSSFTYLDENLQFKYSLTAKNALDPEGTTKNYDDGLGFAKFSGTGATSAAAGGLYTVGANDDPDGTLTELSARLEIDDSSQITSWSAGVARFAVELNVDRQVAPDGPFNDVRFGVYLQDGDGVTIDSPDLDMDGDGIMDHTQATDPAVLRYGRLSLDNTYGSEMLPLPMVMRVEYWGGSVFSVNTDDWCSSFVESALTLTSAEESVTGDNLIKVKDSVTTGATINNQPLTAGDGGLEFSAPGTGGDGWVDVELTVPDYLKFNWYGTGAENSTARATFGIYKGSESIIYLRETTWR